MTIKKQYIRSPLKNVDYIVDYYAILSVAKNIKDFPQKLKKQYYKLSKEHHPDLFEHASDEIKNQIKDKYQIIQEGYKTLSSEESKKAYDLLLEDFRKNKPSLISESGIPILSFQTEIFDIDYLLSDGEWTFQKEMKEKSKILCNYNETVFNIIEDQYIKNPYDLNVKKAYLEQLAIKKASLDMEELFAWQDVGVLNVKAPILLLKDSYVMKTKEKIEDFKKQADKNIEIRLLSVEAYPLLEYLNPNLKELENTELSIAIKEKVIQKIDQNSESLIRIAQKKDEILNRLIELQTIEQIAKVDNLSLQFLFFKDNQVVVGISCHPDENQQANLEPLNSFNGLNLDEVRKQSFVKNTFLIEFNPEIGITYQILSFADKYYNSLG
jgi:hypothetical protein